MREIDIVRNLWVTDENLSLEALEAGFQTLAAQESRYKLRLVSFLCDADPGDLFQSERIADYSIRIREHENFELAELSRVIRRSDIEGGERSVRGRFGFFESGVEGVWNAFTSDSADFFQMGLLKFLEEHRPVISRIFLTSEEMRRFFEDIEERLECEVHIEKAVLYSHLGEGSITFERGHFQSLFDDAEEKNRYVDKIDFSLVEAEGRSIFGGFLSRDCTTYYHHGRVGLLFNVFLPKISRLAAGKDGLFKGKARERGGKVLHAVDLVFPADHLLSSDDNLRFIRALSKVPRSGIAVLHQNPYVHVSLIDFVDGSTFDIFSIEPGRVRIIPAFRSSVHSLMRICDGLFRDFQEGDVREGDRGEVRLEDFLGTQ